MKKLAILLALCSPLAAQTLNPNQVKPGTYQNGSYAYPGSLSAKNSASIGPRYDVTQFGAVGNGITDDTAAIQSALTTCYNGGGGTVEFPGAHFYLVTGSMYAYDGCRLEGQLGTFSRSPTGLVPVQIYTNMGNVSSNTASVTSVVVSNNQTGAQIRTAMDPSNRPASQIAHWELAVTANNSFAANEWVEFSGCTYAALNNIVAQIGSATSTSFTAVFNGPINTGTYSETCTATQTNVVFAFDSVEHNTDSVSDLMFSSHITGSTWNFPEGVDIYYSGRIDAGNNLSRVWFQSPHYFGAYYSDGGEEGKIEEGSRGDGSDYYQVYWRLGSTDMFTVLNSQFGPGAPATHGAATAGGGFLFDNSGCNGNLFANFDHMVMENDVNVTPGLADISMIDCPTSTIIPQFQLNISSSSIGSPAAVTGVTNIQVSPTSDSAVSISTRASRIYNAVNTTNIIVGIPSISLYGQLGTSGYFSDFHYFPSLQSWGLNGGSNASYVQPSQVLGDMYLQNLWQFSVPGSLWLNSDTAFAALPSGTTLRQGQVLAPPAYFDCGTSSGCTRYAVDVVQSPGTVGTLNGGATTCTNTVAAQPLVTCSSATGLMLGQYVTTASGATRITHLDTTNPSAVAVTLANNQGVYTAQPLSYTAPVLGKEIQMPVKVSAAPTTGTWIQGDIVWNSAATSGGTIGWQCVAGGTPGTWVALTSGGSTIPSGTTNQLLYYASSGTTLTPLTLGTNLSITSGTLNASSSGSTNWSALASGTNTTMAALVGTGASLGTTGTGIINASTVATLGSSIASTLYPCMLTNSNGNGNFECETSAGISFDGATNVLTVGGFTDSGLTSTPLIGTDSSGTLVAGTTVTALSFQEGVPGGPALSTGPISYVTIPKACTLTHWDINVDAGTATVQTWKVATGTAIPTVSNTISTSGVSISAGTAIRSSSLSDFTTTSFAAGDIIAANLGTVSGVGFINFELEFTCGQ